MSKTIDLFESTNNASGQFNSGVGASALTINLKSGEGAEFPQPITGSATSGGTATALNSTGIQAAGVVQGDYIKNVTDGSFGYVISVTTNALVTTPLRGGTGNTWDNSDVWAVKEFVVSFNSKDSNGNITASELARVQSRSGDILTIATGGRAFDGTSAQTWAADDYVELFVTSNLNNSQKDAIADLALSKAAVAHAPTHVKGGADELDGDTLDIDYTPTNYTPNTTPPEVTNVDELTAHLSGINTELGGITSLNLTAVLNEDINANEVVRLDATGKFNKLEQELLQGVQQDFEPGAAVETAQIYDVGQDKYVLFFVDSDNSNFGTAIVATLVPATNTLTFGTAVVFNSAATGTTRAAYDANAAKSVVGYQDGGTSSHGYARVCTVSGTVPSFGTAAAFHSGGSTDVNGISYDSTAQKLVFLSRENYSPFYKNAIVGTISGTSISFGTEATVAAYATQGADGALAYDVNANKTVVIYTDNIGTRLGHARVGTISGTSISFGTEATYANAATNYSSIDYDANSSKLILAYQDAGNSNYGTCIIGTVSGTTISFGSEVVFLSASMGAQSSVASSGTGESIITFQNSTFDGAYVQITVSGTTPVVGTTTTLDTDNRYDSEIIFDSVNHRYLMTFRNFTNSNIGESYILQPKVVGAVALGVLQSSGLATETKTATIIGGIDTNFSGLTIGATYYIKNGSTLSTDVSDFAFGIATTATNMLLFKNLPIINT